MTRHADDRLRQVAEGMRAGASLRRQAAAARAGAAPALPRGYTPEQRREIERDLSEGRRGRNQRPLESTSACSDCAMSVGFPASSSLRQQWGRAGRRLGLGTGGVQDQLDQYLATRASCWNGPPGLPVCNPANPAGAGRHGRPRQPRRRSPLSPRSSSPDASPSSSVETGAARHGGRARADLYCSRGCCVPAHGRAVSGRIGRQRNRVALVTSAATGIPRSRSPHGRGRRAGWLPGRISGSARSRSPSRWWATSASGCPTTGPVALDMPTPLRHRGGLVYAAGAARGDGAARRPRRRARHDRLLPRPRGLCDWGDIGGVSTIGPPADRKANRVRLRRASGGAGIASAGSSCSRAGCSARPSCCASARARRAAHRACSRPSAATSTSRWTSRGRRPAAADDHVRTTADPRPGGSAKC